MENKEDTSLNQSQSDQKSEVIPEQDSEVFFSFDKTAIQDQPKETKKKKYEPHEQYQKQYSDTQQLLENALSALQTISDESQSFKTRDKEKLDPRVEELQKYLTTLQDNIKNMNTNMENLYQEVGAEAFQDQTAEDEDSEIAEVERDPDEFISFLKQAKSDDPREKEGYDIVKNQVDDELKQKLSDVTMIIQDLENKDDDLQQEKKVDYLKKKEVRGKLEKSLREYQDYSQILDLSVYIANLSHKNVTMEDQTKLAYIEDKLNKSVSMGKKEIYMIDVYPQEQHKAISGGGGGTGHTMLMDLPPGSFEEEKMSEITSFNPPERTLMRQNSGQTLISGFDDLRSLHFDNYDVSMSEIIDYNSILQSNFYKSLDNFTSFQTQCLKKKLDLPLSPIEEKSNESIMQKLHEKSYFATSKSQIKQHQEDELHSLFTVLGAVFKNQLGVDLKIAEHSHHSDIDKLSYLSHTQKNLYRLKFKEVEYDSLLQHPLTFEKFNSELKFYLASSLKVDPNVIRLIRILENQDGEGIIIDVDIRHKGLALTDIEKNKEMYEKRFGISTFDLHDYLKKINLSIQDFDFKHNRIYSGVKEAQGRGGFPYFLPGSGWKRIGLNIKGKYKDPKGDNWMGTTGNSWAVAYHGLRYENPEAPLQGIISGGFSRGWSNYHECKEFQLDVSINSKRIDHNCIENEDQVRIFLKDRLDDGLDHTCEELSCETTVEKPWEVNKVAHYNYYRPHPVQIKGKTHYFMIAFQCRIKPSEIRIPNCQRDYIIVNGPENVRAYGVMVKQVTEQYYNAWVEKYDYMGRKDQTHDIVYNHYYEVLEKHFNMKIRDDCHIAGHKKDWEKGSYLRRYYFLFNRGMQEYYRPQKPWVRLGLNVEKLFPKIDWKIRLTRGLRTMEEWAVAYMIFDSNRPECYKGLPEYVPMIEKFQEAEKAATQFSHEGQEYSILIQCRYNQKRLLNKNKIPHDQYSLGCRLVVSKDNCLPYGILIRTNKQKKMASGQIKQEYDNLDTSQLSLSSHSSVKSGKGGK